MVQDLVEVIEGSSLILLFIVILGVFSLGFVIFQSYLLDLYFRYNYIYGCIVEKNLG